MENDIWTVGSAGHYIDVTFLFNQDLVANVSYTGILLIMHIGQVVTIFPI